MQWSSIYVLLTFAILLIENVLSDKGAVMFGFTTPDASYVSFNPSLGHNGVTLKNDFAWARQVGESYVCIQGDVADCEEIFSFLKSQNTAHSLDFSEKPMSTRVLAHVCRSLISERLRTSRRLNVNALVAGFEKSSDTNSVSGGKPVLYWLDDVGSLKQTSYAAHGPETPFLLSMLDQRKLDLTKISDSSLVDVDQDSRIVSDPQLAKTVTQECWKQLQKRSRGRVDTSVVRLYRVNKDGCENISLE